VGELPIIGPYVNVAGWLAIIVLIIISWIKGWLWPSNQVDVIIKYYERLVDDKDKQIATWQSAYQNTDTRADILAKGQEQLATSVATNNALIQTLVANRTPIHKETIL